MNKKLSELIREGAKKRPQAFYSLLDTTPDGSQFGTCALGAALEACGVDLLDSGKDFSREFMFAVFGMDGPIQVVSPRLQGLPERVLEGTDRNDLIDEIVMLNDVDGWSRERIADWLESIGY